MAKLSDIAAPNAKLYTGMNYLLREAIRDGMEPSGALDLMLGYLLLRAIGIHGREGARSMTRDIPEVFDECVESLEEALQMIGPL